MKKLHTFCLFIALAALQSCKENKAQQSNEQPQQASVESIPNECYTSIYDEDTLVLKLDTTDPAKIAGTMVMKLYGKPEKDGKIAGAFRGDTLFAYYTFTQGSNKKTTFKNPIALLRKENQLILGNGEIETTMGASYFVKGKPIDFERVKYKFAASDCKGQ